METLSWAEEEMQAADFGDVRLNRRASQVLDAMGNRPNLSIPAACGGRAEMHAAYRFFDNDKVTFEKVLKPHLEQTRLRMATQAEVLVPQDTSEVDLSWPELVVAGAGFLDPARRGVLLHLMHAFCPDGTPLGTVHAEILNRPAVSTLPPEQKRRRNKQIPIEQKESRRWLDGLRQARALATQLPEVRVVALADSEGDIYEWFAEERGEPAIDWVIRACQDRALRATGDDPESEAHLRSRLLATPVLEELELTIRCRRARMPMEDRTRRVDRESRKARLAVRAAAVTLRAPWRPDRVLPPVRVNVVLVREMAPPTDEDPVEWLLLTTLPIDAIEQVRGVIERYRVRWNMEKAQADYPSSGRWVGTMRTGYHRGNGVARVVRVVPATPRRTRWSRRMSDPARTPVPPRA